MLRTLLLSAALGAACTISAYAADDVMSGFYGNTAVATGGMAETHTTYTHDHTFSMRVPAFGVEFKGTWAVNGDQICRTFDSPPPGVSNPLCVPVAAHKVGDTWTMGAGGDTRTITLVKGVQ
jgi:hypothetical protein